jgi:hypothetical protein
VPNSSIFESLFGSQSDPGKYLQGELEEALAPVSSRIDRLEKKLDLLLLTLDRIEKLLIALQPITKIIGKLPFLK